MNAFLNLLQSVHQWQKLSNLMKYWLTCCGHNLYHHTRCYSIQNLGSFSIDTETGNQWQPIATDSKPTSNNSNSDLWVNELCFFRVSVMFLGFPFKCTLVNQSIKTFASCCDIPLLFSVCLFCASLFHASQIKEKVEDLT